MSSYSRLAGLEEEAKPSAKSYSRLASLDEDGEEAAPTPAVEQSQPAAAPWWSKSDFARQGGLAVRAVADALTAMPLAAMNAGVAGRNMLTGSNYQMPSQMWYESLDKVLPKPQTNTEKVVNFLGSTLAGSRLPVPELASPAPANFQPPLSMAKQAVADAQRAGYVLPPATASPSPMTNTLEGIAGKASVAQQASIRNQGNTNALARKALGLADDAPISPATLKGIREEAGQVYAKIANAGEIGTDAQYLDDLMTLGRGADDIAQSFPGANVGATKQVNELVDTLLQPKFESKAALQYLRELRKQSRANLSWNNADDPAKQALGMAQREGANILEEQIERHLKSVGMADVADAFAGARRKIAISHTVENALNESTGNVVAGKLGKDLAKGKPLSGELETIAKFSRAFPKAAKEVTESMPGFSPLDFYAAAAAALVHPSAALVPVARRVARHASLGDLVQGAVSGTGGIPREALTGTTVSGLLQGQRSLTE